MQSWCCYPSALGVYTQENATIWANNQTSLCSVLSSKHPAPRRPHSSPGTRSACKCGACDKVSRPDTTPSTTTAPLAPRDKGQQSMFPRYTSTVLPGSAAEPYAEPHRQEPVSSLLPFVTPARSILSPQGLVQQDTHYSYGPRAQPQHGTSPTLTAKYRKLPRSFVDRLPFEVRLIIANCLPQYDAVHLLRVNRAFFTSTLVRLYHTVVVDPSFSDFNVDAFQSDGDGFVNVNSTTFIKAKYSLKSFLKVLGEDIPIDAPEFGEDALKYSSLINKLQFIELPDGFYTPLDLNFFTFMSIKRLDRLRKFYWESERELSFEVMNRIANKSRISELHLNLDFKRAAGPSDFESFQGFHNLQKLSIEPFLNAYNLFQLFKNLIEGTTDRVLNLRALRLARLNSNHGFIKNPSTSLLVLTTYIIEHDHIKLSDYDLNVILNLFILFTASEARLEELKALALDSIVLTTTDAKRMNSIMNLEKLEYLELKNITEVQLPDNITTPMSLNELYTKLDTGFLRSLSPKLVNLKKLCIDYRESLRDTAPDFISELHGLQELDITIRWNATKLCSVTSWKHLCYNYIRAILTHSSTLTKLSLDTKEDSVFSDFHKLIFTECLMQLKDMSLLESLRLHGYSLQPYATVLAECLPRLKYLELFGSGAGGAPHMGLQVVHNGVFDDWLRVQHVAVAIMEKKKDIKFIKIDKCIFEVKNQGTSVVPRDGLENWFASKVRVSLHSDDFL